MIKKFIKDIAIKEKHLSYSKNETAQSKDENSIIYFSNGSIIYDPFSGLDTHKSIRGARAKEIICSICFND